MKFLKKIKPLILLVSVFVVCYSAAYYVLAVYSEPLHNPPTCLTGEPGCDPPINTSAVSQFKAGSLGVGTVANPAVGTRLEVSSGQIKANSDLTVVGTSYLANVNTYGALAANRDSVAFYRNVLHKYGGVSQTGTIKITLPKYGSNTMIRMRIAGYNYSGASRGTSWEVVVGGYNFSNHAWYNYFAEINGAAPFNQVRLANDGTKDVILLGNTSTVWNYPNIAIAEVMAGFTNYAGWETGWAIEWITDETNLFYNIATPVIDFFRNSSGNIGIGTTIPTAKLDVQGQIVGGFGAMTTAGVLDWNDISNARSGNGYSLLYSLSAANSPIPGNNAYFHPFNFEYTSKNGSGNITQLAIPYASSLNSGLYMRGRYSGTWGSWMRIISENSAGNVGIGTISPASGIKLEVVGGPIKATDGLIMETRTTDPASPSVGQIWMCEDAGYDCQ